MNLLVGSLVVMRLFGALGVGAIVMGGCASTSMPEPGARVTCSLQEVDAQLIVETTGKTSCANWVASLNRATGDLWGVQVDTPPPTFPPVMAGERTLDPVCTLTNDRHDAVMMVFHEGESARAAALCATYDGHGWPT
jgi:hypothetical protein